MELMVLRTLKKDSIMRRQEIQFQTNLLDQVRNLEPLPMRWEARL
jgi:hypothetical protein